MARNENPPFPRGETIYGGDTIDSNDYVGLQLEGMEWVFEDVHPLTGVKRTNRPVRCRVCRNVAAIALLPKRLVKFANTAGVGTSRIDGYAIHSAANDTPEQGYGLDEYLPAAGVPVGDLCWVVMEGPAVCLTTIAQMASDLAPIGWAVAATAATSGATTAGHVVPQIITGATTPLAAQVQNRVGRALSSALTNTTNSDVLLDIGHW